MEERLKRFAVIVDAGTFTKAARELHTSQPALSMAIQKLEHELKTKLIEHKGRGFVLTSAGRLAYESGKRILREGRQLKSAMEEFGQGKPVLKIGSIDNIAELLFVDNDELTALQKHADVSLFVNNSATLITATVNGDIDISLVVEQATYPLELAAEVLGSEELVAVCAPHIQMTVAHRMGKGFLPHFMSYNQSSTTFGLIDNFLRGLEITPEPMFYSTSPSIMLELAVQGKGTAILPKHLVESYVQHGRLVELRLGAQGISRPIVALRDKDIVLNAVLESFISAASRIIGRI